MFDFTLTIYENLLSTFLNTGYSFFTFEEYCNGKRADKFIILRHDVDLKAINSLNTAKIENALNIKASYYFRTLPESNNPKIIKQIATLNHEIGYHYEDMSLCHAVPDRAVEHFKKWLAYFRTFYPVKTICMHGAPTSKYDSKDIWQFADYRSMGLIGEPYFDTDFSKLFYITDTGRRWDGFKVSLRDKIPQHQDEWVRNNLIYRSSKDIIAAVHNNTFPNQLMMTTHPQRWTNSLLPWCTEIILQNLKNIIKVRMIKG